MKNLRTIVASLSVIAVLMLPLAAPVSAADTGNYAGRPNTSTYDGECHWTIYGRVNNRMVLFGPHHCFGMGDNPPGTVIYGRTGIRLGVVADAPSFIEAADMGYMVLDDTQWPFYRNVIAVNGTDWTNTSKYPSATVSCANFLNGTLQNHTIKASYWTETNLYEGPFLGNIRSTGHVDKGSGNCDIRSSIPFDAGSRHIPSGAPVIDWTVGAGSGFVGDMTRCYGNCAPGVDMMFNSWRQAIIDLNNYWETRGTTYGAWFCSNTSCT